jgi:hypothetical protein
VFEGISIFAEIVKAIEPSIIANKNLIILGCVIFFVNSIK